MIFSKSDWRFFPPVEHKPCTARSNGLLLIQTFFHLNQSNSIESSRLRLLRCQPHEGYLQSGAKKNLQPIFISCFFVFYITQKALHLSSLWFKAVFHHYIVGLVEGPSFKKYCFLYLVQEIVRWSLKTKYKKICQCINWPERINKSNLYLYFFITLHLSHWYKTYTNSCVFKK